MALGTTLRTARERRGLTTSQVAEATRMMVQIVDELEREDFHRFQAPIYGRGFIKLYAEFVGIDPTPLLAEFGELYSGSRRPPVATRVLTQAAPRPAPVGTTDAPEAEPSATVPATVPAPSAAVPRPASAAADESGTAPEPAAAVPDEVPAMAGAPEPAAPAPAAETDAPAAPAAPAPEPDLFTLSAEEYRAATPAAPAPRAVTLDHMEGLTRGPGRFARLRDTVEARLPGGWRVGPALLAAAAAVALLALMVVGIVHAFTQTPPPADGAAAPADPFKHVLMPPEPYID